MFIIRKSNNSRSYSFYKTKLSSLTVINIRESVIEIGDNTFKENCNGIKKVTIGESVKKIGTEQNVIWKNW